MLMELLLLCHDYLNRIQKIRVLISVCVIGDDQVV